MPKATTSAVPANASAAGGSGGTAVKRRMQNSACVACSDRRVKCNLRDKIEANSQIPPHLIACSECENRNMACVDPHADKKPTKFRRGKRLVSLKEKLGDRAASRTGAVPIQPPVFDDLQHPLPITREVQHSQFVQQQQQQSLPPLNPQFFESAFWLRFRLQRPILEPNEFAAQYREFYSGNRNALSREGELIARAIGLWACSFGIDSNGDPERHTGPADVTRRKQLTEVMLREILRLIDGYAILRRPSWDGVRVVLLLMPLTESYLDKLERASMYEAAVSQVYLLSRQGDLNAISFGARARLFWYCHVHEGITTGLSGGRLIMEQESMSTFIKLFRPGHAEGSIVHSDRRLDQAYRFATAAVRVAGACRRISAVLTSEKARANPVVDHDAVLDILNDLRMCVDELEELKRTPTAAMPAEVTYGFCDGWTIFLFECQNKMRVNLEERIKDLSRQPQSYVEEVPYGADGSEQPTSQDPSHRLALLTAVQRSHSIVRSTCVNRALEVVQLVQHYKGTRFFAYDAALVRDGAFFAAELLADEPGMDEHVECVYQVLGEMRWAFCRSELYRNRLKAARETRLAREREGSASVGSPATMSDASSQSQGQPMVISGTPVPGPPPMPAPIQAVPGYGQARTSGSGSGSDSHSLSPTSTMGTATSTLVSPTAPMQHVSSYGHQQQHIQPLAVSLSNSGLPMQQQQQPTLQRGPTGRDPSQQLPPPPHQTGRPLMQPGPLPNGLYDLQPPRVQPTPAPPPPAQYDTYMPTGVHPSQFQHQQPQHQQHQQQQQHQQHHQPLPLRSSQSKPQAPQQQPQPQQYTYAQQPTHQPPPSWHAPPMSSAPHQVPRESPGAGPSQQQDWLLLQEQQISAQQNADMYIQQHGVSAAESQQAHFSELQYAHSTPSPPVPQPPVPRQQLQQSSQLYASQYSDPTLSPSFIYPQHLHGQQQQSAHGQPYGLASAPRAGGSLASLYEPPPPLAPDRSGLLQGQHQLNPQQQQQQQQPPPPQNTTTAWNQPQHPQQQVDYHSYYQPQ